MTISILGICGTPVKGETNTEFLLEAVLDAARKQGDDVETDIVRLAEMKIDGGCTHCNWCLERQTVDKFCAKNDDFTNKIAPKLLKADGYVWASPVYLTRMTWLFAAFLDRCRCIAEGRYYGIRGPIGGVAKDKTLAVAAVSWVLHGGVETTCQVLIESALYNEMIVVSGGPSVGLGVSGCSAAPLGQLGAVRQDKTAMRDAKILQIYDGTNEVLRLVTMAAEITG